MKIKTKHELGDEVYFIDGEQIQKGVIARIYCKVYMFGHQIETEESYQMDVPGSNRKVPAFDPIKTVFTKEELIKLL